MDIKIRLLHAEEIECRAGVVNEKGMSILLFKDARVDQKILDEVFTPFGWKRSHQVLDGNLYCTVEIWDSEKQQWIAKQDVGTMSYSEKEKGQASDSFKRACFNWGIGRELYTAPFIWVPAEKAKIRQKGDKWYSEERFHVKEISCSEERAINRLCIVNGAGQVVYQWKRKGTVEVQSAGGRTAGNGLNMQKESFEEEKNRHRPDRTDRIQLSALEQELKRTGVSLDRVLERYRISSLEEMTESIYASAMRDLRKSKDSRIA